MRQCSAHCTEAQEGVRKVSDVVRKVSDGVRKVSHGALMMSHVLRKVFIAYCVLCTASPTAQSHSPPSLATKQEKEKEQ